MRLKISICVFITFLWLACFATADQNPPQSKLMVYYFHRTVRCPSCLLIEDMAKQAVSSGFESELKSGRIELKIINIDEPAQAHFEKDYALEFQSVVLSSVKNGKETSWKNLPLIWDYLEDEDKLMTYIQNEIKALIF